MTGSSLRLSSIASSQHQMATDSDSTVFSMPVRSSHQKKHAAVHAPFSIGSLFDLPETSNGCDGEEIDHVDSLEQNYEISTIQIGSENLKIRQFAFHEANANQIWPGTFTLSTFLTINIERLKELQAPNCTILELGAATGAMSIYLSKTPYNLRVHTSDIADAGEVEANIAFNFELNGVAVVKHIRHTWGNGWVNDCKTADQLSRSCNSSASTLRGRTQYSFIIASDILLYVSAYPALVQTLGEIFDDNCDPNGLANGRSADATLEGPVFIMVWNRRIEQSKLFFQLMVEAGFTYVHEGECVYTFRR